MGQKAGWQTVRELLKEPGLYVVVYFIFINLAAFLVTGADKLSAVRGRRRTPERTLLSLALLGGAAGELCAMVIFRHKTRKLRFAAGIPLIFLAQAALAIYAIFFAG